MKSLRTLITLFVLVSAFMFIGVAGVRAQEKNFTAEELSQFDGKDGRKAYFAFKGKVYDATNSTLWKLGQHFGLQAGQDLTDGLEGAPHGEEVMSKVPMIGTFGDAAVAKETPSIAEAAPAEEMKNEDNRSWYDAPIRLMGMSLLGWTGLILGLVFALNFLTCFALPWSKLPVPWAGARPGTDALDKAPVHKNLASIHKYFAWATVVIGILHGVLGFMQVFFKMYL